MAKDKDTGLVVGLLAGVVILALLVQAKRGEDK